MSLDFSSSPPESLLAIFGGPLTLVDVIGLAGQFFIALGEFVALVEEGAEL